MISVGIDPAFFAYRDEWLDRLVKMGQETVARQIDDWLRPHLAHPHLELSQRMSEASTIHARCGCGASEVFRYAR